MSNPYRTTTLEIPESLERQLRRYRRTVYLQKIGAALLLAVAALLAASLAVFLADRVVDSPTSFRVGVLSAAVLAAGGIPWSIYHWYYRRRHLLETAELVRRRMPRLGDSLVGVLELAADSAEQARSGTLCRAAIQQVARHAHECDLDEAVPPCRLSFWTGIAVTLGTVVLAGAVFFPQATANAWSRLLMPLGGTPRYTFTELEPLPGTIVVAYGEPFSIAVKLADEAKWRPDEATARLGRQPPVSATRQQSWYTFAFEGLWQPAGLKLRIGDARPTVLVAPKQRPELQRIVADIELPAYLERRESLQQDIPSGGVAVLRGSRVQLVATADRVLADASVDRRAVPVDGSRFTTPHIDVARDQDVTLRWSDPYGLSSVKPFVAHLSVVEDRPPTVASNSLPREQTLMTTTPLSFELVARDDYGVRRVGYAWRAISNEGNPSPGATGERVLSSGDPAITTLKAKGLFSAEQLGLGPGWIELRLFVEDYRLDAPRVYSAPYQIRLLSSEQHAAWLGNELHRWRQRALEVRDREMQLHETNRALRSLPRDELAVPETRRRLEQQAAAEEANGRRLAQLSDEGAELIRMAVRNPTLGADQLEQWAAMLRTLHEIAHQRMPAVADLLEAAAAPRLSSAAGVLRDPPASDPAGSGANAPLPQAPSIVDAESSQQGADSTPSAAEAASAGNAGRMTLAQTTVRGPDGVSSQPPTAEVSLARAVETQHDLLAEFQQLSAEISDILANLQGSTLVKRLKAASREQEAIADRINEHLEAALGRDAAALPPPERRDLRAVAARQRTASEAVVQIMDDMAGYQARRPLPRFQHVLAEMKRSSLSDDLGSVAEQIEDDQGWSLALAEYWADTLDRWADELVDPGASSQGASGRSAASLSPEIVLESLRILQSEVALREATRVAEQARSVVDQTAHRHEAERLAREQTTLAQRVQQLIATISGSAEGKRRFVGELELLGGVAAAMNDAAQMLAQHETGDAAIAAETEAIERLLRSQQVDPSGGVAGDAPGGSQSEGEADVALSWVASGPAADRPRNPSEAIQTTGRTGRALPDQYRAGLDQYFNRLEAALDSPVDARGPQ